MIKLPNIRYEGVKRNEQGDMGHSSCMFVENKIMNESHTIKSEVFSEVFLIAAILLEKCN